jgi:hypothetical protein
MMKIRLAVNEKPLVGYVNVDPAPQEVLQGQTVEIRDIKDLTGVCEPSECTEIRAEDVLDYIPFEQLGGVLTGWTYALRHGGKLVIGGTDAMSVSRAYLSGDVNTKQYNELIHGAGYHPWAMKSGQVNMSELSEILERLGLQVIKKRFNGFKMTVEAVRP